MKYEATVKISKHSKKLEALSRISKELQVLVIDDEQDITDIVKKGLANSGVKVTTFNDPYAALSKFGPGRYDLAIIDIRMPGMNGYELFKRMKSIDGKLKICFLTAFEIEPEDFAENGLDQNSVDCFIKKPVSISDLLRKLTAMFQESC